MMNDELSTLIVKLDPNQTTCHNCSISINTRKSSYYLVEVRSEVAHLCCSCALSSLDSPHDKYGFNAYIRNQRYVEHE